MEPSSAVNGKQTWSVVAKTLSLCQSFWPERVRYPPPLPRHVKSSVWKWRLAGLVSAAFVVHLLCQPPHPLYSAMSPFVPWEVLALVGTVWLWNWTAQICIWAVSSSSLWQKGAATLQKEARLEKEPHRDPRKQISSCDLRALVFLFFICSG